MSVSGQGGGRRRITGAERRQRITEAAVPLFAERGYESVAMEDVASGAGVTRPVVYDHFPSKLELFRDLVTAQRDALLVAIRPALDAAAPAEQRARAALTVFFDYVAEHPEGCRMLFREAPHDLEAARTLTEIQTVAGLHVTGALLGDDAVAETDPVRLTLLGEAVGSAVRGLARWWYFNRTVPAAALVETAMDVLWQGLGHLIPTPSAQHRHRGKDV